MYSQTNYGSVNGIYVQIEYGYYKHVLFPNTNRWIWQSDSDWTVGYPPADGSLPENTRGGYENGKGGLCPEDAEWSITVTAYEGTQLDGYSNLNEFIDGTDSWKSLISSN